MRIKLLVILVLCVFGQITRAQTTEFTYQGRLTDGTVAASANYDFEFRLFDAPLGGAPIGGTNARSMVVVTAGVFSVNLDFGAGFPGADRYLEIAVRLGGGGSYTTLSPRQKISSAPYSVKSLNAGNADSSTTALSSLSAVNFSGGLSGDVTGTQVATTVAKLQGRNVANTSPTGGQVLKYNGTTNQWEPDTDLTATGGGGGTITGVTTGAGLTGGGTSGNVSVAVANAGVGTAQLADGGVTSGKIPNGQVVKSLNSLTDTVNLAAGSNITITPSGNTLTIASSGGGGGTITSVTTGTGLTGGGTSGNVSVAVANAGVGTAQLADGGVTNAKIPTGQVVKGINSLTDNVTLAGGANIAIFQTGNTLTFDTKLPGIPNSILNQTTVQPSANFNISGSGTVGGNFAATNLSGNGAALSNLNAGNISSGTLANTRLGLIPTANIADGAVTSVKIPTGQVVKSLNSLTDSVNLVAGSNITITPSGNNLTIASSGSSINAILNQTTQQAASNFNISGNGTAGGTFSSDIVRATTQFNIGGNRILGQPGFSLVAGVGAGQSLNDFAFFNSFFGEGTGQGTTSGSNNSFFGWHAGWGSTGSANSFFGLESGLQNSGNNNAFFGLGAGRENTSGQRNSFFGREAGRANTSGSRNSFVGDNAGETNTTGSDNTLIGVGANVASGGLSFATAVGAGTVVDVSNRIQLGRTGGADEVRIPGPLVLGLLGASGATDVCRNASLQLSVCSSSLKYKSDVKTFNAGLNVVKRLRPITFDWKLDGMHDVGFGAEEVAAVEPLLATYNEKGEIEGVKYKQITTVLVNAVNEQQEQIQLQQAQIQLLLKSNQRLLDRLVRVERKARSRTRSARRGNK